MPALRNKTSEIHMPQEKATNAESSDNDNNEMSDSLKIKSEQPESQAERPASPRRLRDRRLLASSKSDASTNSQQFSVSSKVSSPKKAEITQQNPTASSQPGPNEIDLRIANNNDLTMSFDQLGAINMTKSTSKVKPFNVLVAVTGSVAAIKLIELVRKLRLAFPRSFTSPKDNQTYKALISIKVLLTESSKHFIPKDEIIKNCSTPFSQIEVFDDSDEWTYWTRIGDPVLHIELRKWADLCLIAPLDANTMAKISNGLCDNLLTCTVRAWDTSKPLIYCPAMNVHMFNHPITIEHLERLQSFGYERVDCIEKRLACGDIGLGAMASVDTIVDKVVNALLNSRTDQESIPQTHRQDYPVTQATNDFRDSTFIVDRLANQHSSITARNLTAGSRNRSLLAGAASGSRVSSGNTPSYLLTPSRAMSRSAKRSLESMHQDHLDGTVVDKVDRAPKVVTSLQNLQAVDLEVLARDEADFGDSDIGELQSDGYDCDQYPSARRAKGPINIANSMVRNQPKLSTSTGIYNNTDINDMISGKIKEPNLDPAAYLSFCFNKSKNCFTCVICHHDYKNRKSMSRHLKEQHLQGNIHRCIPCGVSYKRREKLIKHNREHH